MNHPTRGVGEFRCATAPAPLGDGGRRIRTRVSKTGHRTALRRTSAPASRTLSTRSGGTVRRRPRSSRGPGQVPPVEAVSTRRRPAVRSRFQRPERGVVLTCTSVCEGESSQPLRGHRGRFSTDLANGSPLRSAVGCSGAVTARSSLRDTRPFEALSSAPARRPRVREPFTERAAM